MIQELFPGDIQNLNCRSLANNRVLLDILEKNWFHLVVFIYLLFTWNLCVLHQQEKLMTTTMWQMLRQESCNLMYINKQLGFSDKDKGYRGIFFIPFCLRNLLSSYSLSLLSLLLSLLLYIPLNLISYFKSRLRKTSKS